ncbi:alpha/beta hydrolase [Herbaspirillum lusitanum]|uniref:Alpha/beta hydrolase n=1 Tax=Herbaspirillum lusitanum TaxID=213312 RepID=A0ABW9ACP6_9BURK
MKPSRSEFLQVRGLRYHIRQWGDPQAPRLFMLHGWMDVSASFQFMVDALAHDWHVIAPDWRGFGLSQRTAADTYWFPDYLADLDAILLHYAPDNQAVNLLGHSMGGNVAGLYAGIRPARIARLINLEGVGMPTTRPEQAPRRFAAWMDEVLSGPAMRSYASLPEVAARLQKTNPRLSDARAEFLSAHWAAQNADGQWDILGDPLHKQTGPMLYRVDEVTACWQQITAPVLWVEAQDSDLWRYFGSQAMSRAEIDRRITFVPQVQVEKIANAGHMLHHDQPELLAAMVEKFLAQ